MGRLRRAAIRCATRSGAWFVVGLLVVGSRLDPATAADSASPRPEYRRWLEIPLLAGGAAVVAGGIASSPDRELVPDAGLDPAAIRLAFDRNIVGNRDVDANSASNIVRNAAIALPFVLSFVSAPQGERCRAPLDRTLLFVESVALSAGVGAIAKSVVSRPRPYTYLSASDRPAHPRYDVDEDRTFESMPSGHAITSWCAASFGVVDHLFTRPAAGWKEQAAVGFAGGALATTTSVLRVEAGQHFPSDVAAGACIGIAGGVTIPLLHRYVLSGERAPSPSRASWLAAAAGMAAGTGIALLVNATVGP